MVFARLRSYCAQSSMLLGFIMFYHVLSCFIMCYHALSLAGQDKARSIARRQTVPVSISFYMFLSVSNSFLITSRCRESVPASCCRKTKREFCATSCAKKSQACGLASLARHLAEHGAGSATSQKRRSVDGHRHCGAKEFTFGASPF